MTMTRLTAAFLSFTLAAPSAGDAAVAEPPAKPNIVFIMADDMGYGDPGGFTQPAVIKPGPGKPEGQLYNLADDLAETNNLYQKHPQIVERLTNLLGLRPVRNARSAQIGKIPDGDRVVTAQ